MQIDGVARNFVAYDVKFERLFRTFAQHSDADRGAAWPFQHVGDFTGAEVIGRLAIDGNDDVARMNAGAERRRSEERRDHNDFIVARPDGHTHAVILAVLFLAHQRVLFWIKEAGVRVEDMQHARNCAVVNGFVGVHRLGVVLLDDAVDLGKAA